MLVLPLNIMGVFLFSKIGRDVSIKWKMPHFSSHIMSVNLTTSEWILLSHLGKSDGDSSARIIERATCISARLGLFDFTFSAMDILMKRKELDLYFIKQSRKLVQFEQSILDRLIRTICYRDQIWQLHHIPAWIIPSLVKQMSSLVKERRITIYSAGHMLLRKYLKWEWKKPHLQVFPCEEVPTVTRYLE